MTDASRPANRSADLNRVKAYISAGGFAPGDRLPAERVLIDELGLTRSRLRHALDRLEQDGRIWRHVGKGTFLSDERRAPVTALTDGLARRLTPVRMMRARLAIEPAIAREAAVNASEEAVQHIRAARKAAEEALDWAGYEAGDDAFHRAIAEAADNLLLAALHEQMIEVRRAVAWSNVVRQTDRPPAAHPGFAEHGRIARAIEAHDPAAAQDAMRDHLVSVSARLFLE